MNKWAFGALAGIAGGGQKYQEIQDEQRAFDLDEIKATNAQNRKESYSRFNYTLQDSGLTNQRGQKFTNEQVSGMSGEESGALQSRSKYDTQIKADATQTAKDAAFGDKVSQYMTEDGIKILNKDLESERAKGTKLISSGEYGRQSSELRDVASEERYDKKQEDRLTAATKIENAKFVKARTKEIKEAKSESMIPGAVGETIAALSLMRKHRGDPRYMEMPEVKHAVMVEKNAPKVLVALEEAKAIFKSRKDEQEGVRDQMVKQLKISQSEAQEYIDFLKQTGQYK